MRFCLQINIADSIQGCWCDGSSNYELRERDEWKFLNINFTLICIVRYVCDESDDRWQTAQYIEILEIQSKLMISTHAENTKLINNIPINSDVYEHIQ